MKIGQKPELPGALAQKQAKPAAPAAEGVAARTASAAAAGVPVTFSNAARAIDQTSRSQGDFDAGKVKAVRAAIENGTFRVNAEVVADKMLANTEEFLSRERD